MHGQNHIKLKKNQVLTSRMTFILVDGSAYVNFNMTYHKGMNFTEIKTKAMFDGNIRRFIMTTS